MTVLTALFLIDNLIVMFTHKATNFTSSNLFSYFAYNDTFTADDGFRFAIALPYNDEDIFEKLEFIAYIESEDFTVDPKLENKTNLELHNCTEEELDDFYPINDS